MSKRRRTTAELPSLCRRLFSLRLVRLLPDLQRAVACNVLEIIVVREHREVMTDAKLGQQSVDRSDLHSGPPAAYFSTQPPGSPARQGSGRLITSLSMRYAVNLMRSIACQTCLNARRIRPQLSDNSAAVGREPIAASAVAISTVGHFLDSEGFGPVQLTAEVSIGDLVLQVLDFGRTGAPIRVGTDGMIRKGIVDNEGVTIVQVADNQCNVSCASAGNSPRLLPGDMPATIGLPASISETILLFESADCWWPALIVASYWPLSRSTFG